MLTHQQLGPLLSVRGKWPSKELVPVLLEKKRTLLILGFWQFLTFKLTLSDDICSRSVSKLDLAAAHQLPAGRSGVVVTAGSRPMFTLHELVSISADFPLRTKQLTHFPRDSTDSMQSTTLDHNRCREIRSQAADFTNLLFLQRRVEVRFLSTSYNCQIFHCFSKLKPADTLWFGWNKLLPEMRRQTDDAATETNQNAHDNTTTTNHLTARPSRLSSWAIHKWRYGKICSICTIFFANLAKQCKRVIVDL